MIIAELKKTTEHKMQKSVEALKADLAKVRTGRAHTGLLDHVMVDYYGSLVPINQVANVTLLDARTIGVQPWEKGMGPKIEKAIRESDLGLNPSAQGDLLRAGGFLRLRLYGVAMIDNPFDNRRQAGAANPHLAGERDGDAVFLEHLGDGFMRGHRPPLSRGRKRHVKGFPLRSAGGHSDGLKGFAMDQRFRPALFDGDPTRGGHKSLWPAEINRISGMRLVQRGG